MATTYWASPDTLAVLDMDTVDNLSAAYEWQSSTGVALQAGAGSQVVGWVTSNAAGGTLLNYAIETSHDGVVWTPFIVAIPVTVALPSGAKPASTATGGLLGKPLKYLRLRCTVSTGTWTGGNLAWGIS